MVRGTRSRIGAGFAVAAATLLVLLFLVPAPASAAVTCAYDGTDTVTVNFVAGDSITLKRSGDIIQANGANCQTGADIATVTNTDTIVFAGAATGNESLTIDLSAGPFEPGKGNAGEGGGVAEIEIDFDSGGNGMDVGNDTVTVIGSSAVPPPVGAGDDVFWISDTGIDFNDDGDEDFVSLNFENVVANGGAGDDYLDASATTAVLNTLNGGDGYDEIWGGPLADTISGGNDDDYLAGEDGNDAVNGDAGFDFADYSSAGAGVTVNLQGSQTATGGAGSDALSGIEGIWGSAFNDTLTGEQNVDNWIAGGDGDDAIDGNTGVDTVDYSDAGSAVTVDLTLTTPQATGGSGTDTLSEIENVWGSAFGDTITGDAGDNTITGGAGNDTMVGGDGIDAVDYSDFPGPGPAGVTVDLSVDTAQVTGYGSDTISEFENLWGSEFNDTLIGDDGDNEIDGWDGVDTTSYAGATSGVTVDLFNEYADGGGGADFLYGFENAIGSAFDDMIGGTDDDNVLNGGDGDDTLDYSMASAGVSVDLSVAVAQDTGGAGVDTIANFENLYGSVFDDVLSGDAGDNWLVGWTGDDSIDGGDGTDTMDYSAAPDGVMVDLLTGAVSGGDGADDLTGIEDVVGSAFDDFIASSPDDNTLDGGDGVDTVSFQFAAAAVNVDLGAGVSLGDGLDLLSGFENVKGSNWDDVLVGDGGDNKLQGTVGNDNIKGKGGADRLGGADGADTIRGGSGPDVLKGGPGPDFLAGGKGKDTCKGGPGKDTIKSCE